MTHCAHATSMVATSPNERAAPRISAHGHSTHEGYTRMPTKTKPKTSAPVATAPAPTHPISEAAVVLANAPAVREELETQADAIRRSAAVLAADLAALEAAYDEQADGLAMFRDRLA